jgi:glycosyltransferase involved in cell wall biosynthesis
MISQHSLPLVSIIIDCYNQDSLVKDAIESAISQSYSNIELIVVDDGSTDKSREVISRYGNSIFPVFKPNGGQSSALNIGFKESHGEIICFLDGDDLFFENKVFQVADAFASNPEIDWCFHPLRYINESLDKVITDYPLPPSDHSCEIDFRNNIIKNGVIPVWGPATSAISLRRSLAEKIFPIPECLKIASDAYLRYPSLALSKGYFLNQPLSYLRVHGNNVYNSNINDDVSKKRYAKSLILQANALRNNFPEMAKVSNKLFAWGLADLGKDFELEMQNLIHDYWCGISFWERAEVYFKRIYHQAKQIALKNS